MTYDQAFDNISKKFNVIGTIDLGQWPDNYALGQEWLRDCCRQLWRERFEDNDRIIVRYEQDIFVSGQSLGLILQNLQVALNKSDITNSFVLVISTDKNISDQIRKLSDINKDKSNSMSFISVNGPWKSSTTDQRPYNGEEIYQYGSVNPIKIRLADIDDRKRFLLAESKTFCMYPWVHLHAYPTSEAYPCCQADMKAGPLGSVKEHTLSELWNSQGMKQLRKDMLDEKANPYCVQCYEQEQAGFFSGRQSANKHHGHHIDRIDDTASDGSLSRFQMTYWDIRFSNLCNLRCRSCGHIFSSSWYADQKTLVGSNFDHPALFYAGRTETDMWEQLLPHMDYVEQIYFAGGEPLMMDEHYRILDELERRGRFDVRLIYNTNFTQVKLKDRYVFDYWKKFQSVAVGASLDAMGPRAEYIRKGTVWSVVEHNRKKMLEICPNVDFYISPTLSIMNALHVADFHRDWVEQGLLKPQDLNINVLQGPVYYRVDIGTAAYKKKIRDRIQSHLDWLRPLDKLNRATQGFESMLNFMDATDNQHLIPVFWSKTAQLDKIRSEQILDVIPELADLK